MSGEMKVSRWRLPLVIGSVVVLAAAIAVGIGTLIAHDQAAKPTPAAFASKASSPSAAVGDPHSRKACELNNQARANEKLGDVPTVQAIYDEAEQSKDSTILFAAQVLYDKQQISNREIARGGDNLDLALAAFGASVEMTTACINIGIVP